MRRPDARRAALAAVDLLVAQESLGSVFDLASLRVCELSLPVKVIFDSYAGFCEKTGLTHDRLGLGALPDGVTLRRDGLYIVLYNECVQNAPRRAFTLAHEVGHILLGHSGEAKAHAQEEREADAFATSLLCPACVARYLAYRDGAWDAQLLATTFCLSHQAALRRQKELALPAKDPLTAGEIALRLKLFGSAAMAVN